MTSTIEMDEAFQATELSLDWSNIDHSIQDPYQIIKDIIESYPQTENADNIVLTNRAGMN